MRDRVSLEGETALFILASTLDATAKQMLTNIYRDGAYLAQWAKNGHANGNGVNGQHKAAVHGA